MHCTDGIITLTIKLRKYVFHRISQSFSVNMKVSANMGKLVGRFAKLLSHVVTMIIKIGKRLWDD